MINKKRQESIIQNLQSISSEVRIKSITQLVNLPLLKNEEKIELLNKLQNDSNVEVQNAAVAAIKSLSGGANVDKSQNNGQNLAPAGIPASQTISLPSIATEATPDVTLSPLHQPTSAATPAASAFQTSSPLTPPPRAPQPVAAPLQPAVPVAPAVAPPPQPAMDEFIDPPDPSLPDLKSIKSVPDILELINKLAKDKLAGHLGYLLKLSEHYQEEVALTALQTIVNLNDSRAPSQALKLLAVEGFSSQKRFLLLKIVMGIPNAVLSTSLLESVLLKETDVIVKSGLVKVFARNCKDSGVPTLIKCLQDTDPRVRANTIEVIEEQKINGCDEHILQLLSDEENRVKVNAAKYLVKNGYPQAFKTLRTMLVSSEVWLRDSVIFALGEIGDQASMTLLKAALKDPSQGIRLSVLKAMARINNRLSRQILQAASGDPDPVVAQVAVSLWNKIKDTPENPCAVLPSAPAAHSTQPAASVAPPVAPPAPVSQPVAPVAPPVAPPTPVSQPVAPVAPPVAPPTPPSQPAAPVAPPVAPPAPVPQPSASVAPRVAPPAPAVSLPTMPEVADMSAGDYLFKKPRSAEVYKRFCSGSPENLKLVAKDLPFIMGEDQQFLLGLTIKSKDDNLRLVTAKILTRKRDPNSKKMLASMQNDSNEHVRSLVSKALLMSK